MYALMEFKGKQYKAEKGACVKVDLIDAEPGSALNIDSVLMVFYGYMIIFQFFTITISKYA